jgi:glycosyltransferase involved in cell wall biosynthesis
VTAIVIDDGSSDGTADIARAAGAKVVAHRRNRGLATAFRTAISTALRLRADIAVTMDADLQFDPGEIMHLTEPIQSGRADFVAGTRFANRRRPARMPRSKYWGNRLMTGLVNMITHSSFDDVSCGFRAYSYEALLNINIQSAFTYTQETFIELAAKGIPIEHAPISVQYFPDRESYISANLLRYGIRTLLTIARTTRDYAPFMVFGSAACVLLFPGLLAALFVIGYFAFTGSFSPYIFVALIAAYLITLGIALLLLALATDMLRGIRNNQEKLIYFEKKSFYGANAQKTD